MNLQSLDAMCGFGKVELKEPEMKAELTDFGKRWGEEES